MVRFMVCELCLNFLSKKQIDGNHWMRRDISSHRCGPVQLASEGLKESVEKTLVSAGPWVGPPRAFPALDARKTSPWCVRCSDPTRSSPLPRECPVLPRAFFSY